jgi:hypothetical protein
MASRSGKVSARASLVRTAATTQGIRRGQKKPTYGRFTPAAVIIAQRFTGGAAADGLDDLGDLGLDDVLAEFLVCEPELLQIVIIEKVAEGTVTDIMEERGNAKKLLNKIGGRAVRHRRFEGGIEVTGKPAREVHGAEGMLEPAVLGRGIYPPRALKLIDLTQTLHPGRVDQVLLGLFPRPAGRGERDIPVDRITKEGSTIIEFFAPCELAHGIIIPGNAPESTRKADFGREGEHEG